MTIQIIRDKYRAIEYCQNINTLTSIKEITTVDEQVMFAAENTELFVS